METHGRQDDGLLREILEKHKDEQELLEAPLSLLMEYNLSLGSLRAAEVRTQRAYTRAIEGRRLLKEKGMGVKRFLKGSKTGGVQLLHIPREVSLYGAPLCGAPSGTDDNGAAFLDGAILCKTCVRIHGSRK